VLGAHNTPVASPSVLPEVAAAYEGVRAGKIAPFKTTDETIRYKLNDIGFLMRAPQ
jgi:hypothetical protein